MASVTIDRAPICSDPADEVPPKWWPVLIDERRQFCKHRLPADCRMLSYFVEDGEKADWLGYGSREAYLSEGLQLDPEIAELAIKGLEFCDPDKAIRLKRAVVLGKYGGDRGTARDDKGRFVKSSNKPQPDNIRLRQYGTSREDTLARLHRDHHELAARVEAGELSANAAAIEAGFRKPPKPRLTHCPSCGVKL